MNGRVASTSCGVSVLRALFVGGLMKDDVLRRLPPEIAAQVSDTEQEELARRLELQDRLAGQLRALPLRETEPSLAVSLERER